MKTPTMGGNSPRAIRLSRPPAPHVAILPDIGVAILKNHERGGLRGIELLWQVPSRRAMSPEVGDRSN
jgi:hypothetical protein